ncbi:enoyl-CoA hydratase [Tamaricihabitans halophyticus]|uniref:Enoyl-CoA hydratase n=1 Tax=Tamaricihabitans halophyticus TaxID=1262583 RepID=A0A4R2QKK2_9PSEU|nr:enoyl-CoA hydratase [Tamaricihabitans halophyticus]TCP49970.1 enoyl-CoA hydratase [Tamaricihabitans halophyticus]
MEDATVVVSTVGRISTVTLNRPGARNAISSALLRELRAAFADADANPEVGAIVLTGADPAFCAGLDLNELGNSGTNLRVADRDVPVGQPWRTLSTPIIGAINGAAVTGGLEFALHCDILVASERARFADTHARIGVLPGWGLSVLLPLAVGRGMARRMSLTGDYVPADVALRAGLVTEVVAHQELLPAARRVAESVVSNDQDAVRALLASYREIELALSSGGTEIEARTAREWLARGDPSARVAARRDAVVARGRAQYEGQSLPEK